MPADAMEKVVNLFKRRGFVFPGSEIYGGLGASLDYGPLGVELKRNVKDAWWRAVVTGRDDVVGLDCAVIMHPRMWEASGHIAGFTDPLVDCKKCKQRFQVTRSRPLRARSGGELTSPPVQPDVQDLVGPMEDTAHVAYLRPETAQGMFVNFKNVVETSRLPVPPFGIAQTGRSPRNDHARELLFRTWEFEQISSFVRPRDDQWLILADRACGPVRRPGIRREPARGRTAPTSSPTTPRVDIEHRFPFGWPELEGIANRNDFDPRHAEFSGATSYFDEERRERFLPVIEPAAGVDRSLFAFLVDVYDEDVVEGEARTCCGPAGALQGGDLSPAPRGGAAGTPVTSTPRPTPLPGRLRPGGPGSGDAIVGRTR
jgi:glycyl-tRNA synthetase